jgi:hypothetical protein
MNPQIDYSNIAPPVEAPRSDDWDPPVHKFFGKKLENGKMEKEPVYTYQEYPRVMYARPDPQKPIITAIINSDAELRALGDGWEKNPSAFGFIGAPSQEETLRLQGSPVIALKDAQREKEAQAAKERTEAALAIAQAETDKRIAEQRAADEAALQKRIADALAAALPAAVAAAIEQKRGPGRPKAE